jgi:hypothetical protein
MLDVTRNGRSRIRDVSLSGVVALHPIERGEMVEEAVPNPSRFGDGPAARQVREGVVSRPGIPLDRGLPDSVPNRTAETNVTIGSMVEARDMSAPQGRLSSEFVGPCGLSSAGLFDWERRSNRSSQRERERDPALVASRGASRSSSRGASARKPSQAAASRPASSSSTGRLRTLVQAKVPTYSWQGQCASPELNEAMHARPLSSSTIKRHLQSHTGAHTEAGLPSRELSSAPLARPMSSSTARPRVVHWSSAATRPLSSSSAGPAKRTPACPTRASSRGRLGSGGLQGTEQGTGLRRANSAGLLRGAASAGRSGAKAGLVRPWSRDPRGIHTGRAPDLDERWLAAG